MVLVEQLLSSDDSIQKLQLSLGCNVSPKCSTLGLRLQHMSVIMNLFQGSNNSSSVKHFLLNQFKDILGAFPKPRQKIWFLF